MNKYAVLFLAFSLILSSSAQAGLMIAGTRFIFHEQEKNISIQMSNVGDAPLLAEAWISKKLDDTSPEEESVPFVISPPVSKLVPKAGQLLRISLVSHSLPADKESLFWLNILEIPPRSAKVKSSVQIAVHSRMKLIYRPKQIPDATGEAIKSLRWYGTSQGIKVKNTTPYVISFANIMLQGNNLVDDKGHGDILEPGGEYVYKVSGAASGKEISVSAMNDSGGTFEFKSKIL